MRFSDEIYFVITGSGEYICDESRQRFGPTDILFAAAGVEHRFENFSDDLALLGCVLWARRRRIQWRMKNGTVSLDCSLLRCS
jgi:mannose-6-phosphate isomerase-like protein (cupin superfamily)